MCSFGAFAICKASQHWFPSQLLFTIIHWKWCLMPHWAMGFTEKDSTKSTHSCSTVHPIWTHLTQHTLKELTETQKQIHILQVFLNLLLNRTISLLKIKFIAFKYIYWETWQQCLQYLLFIIISLSWMKLIPVSEITIENIRLIPDL